VGGERPAGAYPHRFFLSFLFLVHRGIGWVEWDSWRRVIKRDGEAPGGRSVQQQQTASLPPYPIGSRFRKAFNLSAVSAVVFFFFFCYFSHPSQGPKSFFSGQQAMYHRLMHKAAWQEKGLLRVKNMVCVELLNYFRFVVGDGSRK
jgi:hypothetical protein